MTLFSPIKSTDTNPGILDDNRTHHGKAWLIAVAVVQRIAIPRIGSVACFLVPWVIAARW